MSSILTTELQSALAAVQSSMKSTESKIADATGVLGTLKKAEADIKSRADLLGVVLADIEGFGEKIKAEAERVEEKAEKALGIQDGDEAPAAAEAPTAGAAPTTAPAAAAAAPAAPAKAAPAPNPTPAAAGV